MGVHKPSHKPTSITKGVCRPSQRKSNEGHCCSPSNWHTSQHGTSVIVSEQSRSLTCSYHNHVSRVGSLSARRRPGQPQHSPPCVAPTLGNTPPPTLVRSLLRPHDFDKNQVSLCSTVLYDPTVDLLPTVRGRSRKSQF